MDKIHKWIITVAAVLIVIWILSKGFLFTYNLTAVVNGLTNRVTNIERALTAPPRAVPTPPQTQPTN